VQRVAPAAWRIMPLIGEQFQGIARGGRRVAACSLGRNRGSLCTSCAATGRLLIGIGGVGFKYWAVSCPGCSRHFWVSGVPFAVFGGSDIAARLSTEDLSGPNAFWSGARTANLRKVKRPNVAIRCTALNWYGLGSSI
jgi:hypothetical protein